jgi:hypothetical protein
MQLYPLSQSIRTGYEWAAAHGIEHNHDQLFKWGRDESQTQKTKAVSACAVGFGWIGNLLLNGTDEEQVLTVIREVIGNNMEEYDHYVRDTTDPDRACPHGDCEEEYPSLASMVVHLNDAHNWKINDIIEYVLTQEPDEETLEIKAASTCALARMADELGLEQDLEEVDLPW